MDQVNHQPEVKRIFGNILIVFIALTLPGVAWTLFGWLHIFLPVLVIVFLNKYGFNIGNRFILAGAGLAFFVGLISQSIDILLFSCSMIPAGYVLSRSGLQGDKPAYSGLKGAATLTLCWILLIGGFGLTSGVSPYSSLVNSLNTGIDEALRHYQQSESLAPDAMMMLETTLNQMKVVLPIIMPAIFISCALFSTWLSMVLSNRIVFRFCNRHLWPQFRFWQLPDRLIWLGIGSALFTFLLSGMMREIAVNLLIILSVIYCFQGFAICVFFMNKWNVPFLFRSFIYVMIVFQSFGTLLLLIAGVVDTWFDFRKLNPVTIKSEENNTDE